jgi:hypothetical protein
MCTYFWNDNLSLYLLFLTARLGYPVGIVPRTKSRFSISKFAFFMFLNVYCFETFPSTPKLYIAIWWNINFSFIISQASMAYMNIILAMNVPDHWCNVPGREMTKFDAETWKNITLPRWVFDYYFEYLTMFRLINFASYTNQIEINISMTWKKLN